MQAHHSYVTRASSLELSSVPLSFKNPAVDVLHVVRDRLSIDDVREVTLQAQQRPFQAEKRVFVFVVHDIAIEAQNALLKLFEEPPQHALFYVVIPQTLQLLPTLASRLASFESAPQEENGDVFNEFLRLPYAERLEEIAKRTKVKDQVWIESVLKGCEQTASTLQDEHLLAQVIFVRSYIKTKGASAKMLLEELALLLPVK